MEQDRITLSSIWPAVYRARWAILAIACTYFLTVLIGIVMVQAGSGFALEARDNLIKNATASDPAALAFDRGNRLQASLIDFSENLLLGAATDTVAGMGIITAFPLVAYRGWIGGIVSINNEHQSRLGRPDTAVYYSITLILQLIPYSLAGGAGVKLGLAFYRQHSDTSVKKWLGIPKATLLDVVRIYLLVIPLFLLASLWEFFA